MALLAQVAAEDYAEAERLKVQMEEEWAKLEKMRDTALESAGIELPLPAKDEPWHVKRLRRMTPAQREMVSRPDATMAACVLPWGCLLESGFAQSPTLGVLVSADEIEPSRKKSRAGFVMSNKSAVFGRCST